MLKYDERGLIPAIIQDAENGDVLMLGYINEESLKRTLESGQVWFWSRSRQELWHKGATSGNYLNLRAIFRDCDDDALLLQVDATGPVCHTGNRSCFYRRLEDAEEA
jgi:phosphoribosyl-AMP cyclohydrolase